MSSPMTARDRAKTVPRAKDVPWFQSNIGSSLTPAGRRLLEEYSGIDSSDVEAHIYKIVAPRLLDLGTCLGQDLRQLVADGAPQANLYGADLFSEYESVGHQLFRDADRFTNRFITADLLDDSDDGPLARTGGTWDMVNIIMFLHIWDHSTQVAASKRILKLLKKQAGSMIIGAQTGSTEPGELVLKPPYVAAGEERSIYRHSVETFSDMWKEIEKQSDVKMEIKAMYDEPEAREILAKEEESGERKFFFKRSAEQRKLFFTIELL
ncbi:MAG: hypothetical protein LQ343_001501 [Gyalolechia ehrenbergii]|nr:MAG: hypothetical protein LQ343_001501 [Gyalolechia ehrenbergii]